MTTTVVVILLSRDTSDDALFPVHGTFRGSDRKGPLQRVEPPMAR